MSYTRNTVVTRNCPWGNTDAGLNKHFKLVILNNHISEENKIKKLKKIVRIMPHQIESIIKEKELIKEPKRNSGVKSKQNWNEKFTRHA